VPCTQYFDAFVVTVCRILRLCAGPSAIPTLVTLPYQSDVPPAAYQEAIGCPVEFGADRCTLKFDAELAARPVLTGNPELAAEADRMARATSRASRRTPRRRGSVHCCSRRCRRVNSIRTASPWH
jgi:hypothetical protein